MSHTLQHKLWLTAVLAVCTAPTLSLKPTIYLKYSHYAAKLDGCGLELENQVRKSYRLLLQRLLEGLAAFSPPLTM